MNHVPFSAKGTNHEGLGSVAEATSRSSWPTLALHPRGGHCWLSASLSPAFTELEKIEKLPALRNSRGFDEFQEDRALDFANCYPPTPTSKPNHDWVIEEAASASEDDDSQRVWGTRAFL